MEEANPPDSLQKRRSHKAKKTSSRSSISRSDFSRTHITSHSTTNTTAATAATTSTYYYTRTGKIDLDVERNREEAGDCFAECSGQSCQSCSATLLADCVAVCCCPLAVVSFLALAFIKVPYVMGRRCLVRTVAATRRRKKKMIQQQMLRSKQKQCNNSSSKDDSRRGSSSSSTGSTGSSGSGWKYDDFVVRRGKDGKSRDIVFEFGEMKGETEELVEQRISLCRGFLEVDSVLLELYQVGHLGFGFGRLSFTGIQGNNKSGKSN